MTGEGLSEVFAFYLKQLGKLIDTMRQIPIFEGVSLFDTIIALGLISIFMKIIKYGFRHDTHTIRIYDTNKNYEGNSERRD